MKNLKQVKKHLGKGFTLIELMITLVIAAILMVVAIPNLTAFKRNAELTSAANGLLGAINAARSEAMKRGMYAMVVPMDGVSWNTNGLAVFVDKDGSRTYDNNRDQTVMTQAVLPSYLSISAPTGVSAGAATPYLMFDASGYPKTKSGGIGNQSLTLSRTDLSGTELYDQTRRLVIAPNGRVRICKPASATDANCLASGSL